jgi:protease I
MSVAILTAELFEDVELWYPYYRLLEAGFDVELVGGEAGRSYPGKRGTTAAATLAVADLSSGDVEGIVVPGGYSPDHMRRIPEMVGLLRDVGEAGKPAAAICHGPWMLASAGLVSGRRVTSFPSIRDDLVNAGGEWVDEAVVVDGNVVTSRTPADLPAFMPEVLRLLG